MKSAYSIIINKHTIIVWFFNEPVLKTKITIMAIGTREYQMWKLKFLFTMQWITQMFWGFCRSHRCMFWQTAKRLESIGAFLAGQPHSETYKKKYKKNTGMFTTYDARITNFTWIIGQQFCLESLHDESKVLIWMGFSLYTRFSNFVAL